MLLGHQISFFKIHSFGLITKNCIIDHTYAFLGGIDLCYGRYDTPDHALTDDSGVDFPISHRTIESQQKTLRISKFSWVKTIQS